MEIIPVNDYIFGMDITEKILKEEQKNEYSNSIIKVINNPKDEKRKYIISEIVSLGDLTDRTKNYVKGQNVIILAENVIVLNDKNEILFDSKDVIGIIK